MALADSRHPRGGGHERTGGRLRRPVGVLWPDVGEDVFSTGHLPVGSPASLVHGLVTRVFAVDLPVAGRVAGVAFHPGGLAALLDSDVGELTGRVVPATAVLGAGVRALARTVLAEREEGARHEAFIGYVGALLQPRLEAVDADDGYRTVRAAAELMRAREHLTLTPVAEQLGVSGRTLQRLFRRYVGASPLWVLRRYRLQDAAAAIDAGEGADLAALAADLGFADQAHFTRSFTQVIGVPPSVYRQPGSRGAAAVGAGA